jgi:hypothetical protein
MRGETWPGPIPLYAFFLCMCLAMVVLGDKPLVRAASASALLAATAGVVVSLRLSKQKLRIVMLTTAALAVASTASTMVLRSRHGGSAVDGSCVGTACDLMSRGERHPVEREVYVRVAASEIAVLSLISGFMGLGLFPRRPEKD